MTFLNERPRALALRTCWPLLATLSLGAFGCAADLDELDRRQSQRESLGHEIYKVLCRRVAANELPDDVDGRNSETLCLGDDLAASEELAARRNALPPRLVALAERRSLIADAFDESLPPPLSDGVETLMRKLLPFYDAPEERMQESTRATAALLQRLARDEAALDGLSRFAREGMLSAEGESGLLRGVLGYRDISAMLRSVAGPLTAHKDVVPAFKATLEGAALELATMEQDADANEDACRLRSLLLRTEQVSAGQTEQLSSDAPLFSVVRDVRGMPVPTRPDGTRGRDFTSACGGKDSPALDVPFPFVDADGDGFADIDGARFQVRAGVVGRPPEPFTAPYEPPFERDEYGRAYGFASDGLADKNTLLYETLNADATLMAGVMREASHAFAGENSLLTMLGGALPALLGDEQTVERTYGGSKHSFTATDLSKSPLLDLVHALGALLDDPVYDASLELGLQTLRDHEPAMVAAMLPLLKLEERTRVGTDAYPEAALEKGNTFWDEVLWELEKLSRLRKTRGGETIVEALAQAMLGRGRNFDKPGAPFEQLIDPKLLARQGALLSAMLRFKDEWRINPIGVSKRQPGDPNVIGAFKTPVDRTQPDTPITCGKDGCAGEIVGSPFEPIRQPGQNCVIQRSGRPASGRDCGKPSNQSLFQRSLGMLAEMEGRAQCNRPITVADLFDFAAEGGTQSPLERQRTVEDAERALAKDYTCADSSAPCGAYIAQYPAAFADADGAGPAKPTIAACALLNEPDVGRTFGKVLTHEYVLTIPNPWVRRYLEDVARAADPSLPACPEHAIKDPTVLPRDNLGALCMPEAARLSRDVFEDLTDCAPTDLDCVDTLGELVEFLLDDKSLFRNDADAAALRPDSKALSRVMFTPAGRKDSFELFEPLLVRGAPPFCAQKPSLKACVDDAVEPAFGTCCIKDPMEPPLRYRLDTYYGSTTFAWEQPLKLKDGTQLTFLDAMGPVADAFNRLDPAPGADPKEREDARYGLTVLGSVVAQHFDSPANLAVQSSNPAAPGYRKLTGLVRYEELLADLLDDGSVDLTQAGPNGGTLFDPALSYDTVRQLGLLSAGVELLSALDKMTVRGRSGLQQTATIAEHMLNPHAYCAGDTGDSRIVAGQGACATNTVRAPLTTRDGRDYKCWTDGTCFDGKEGREKRFISAVDLLLHATTAMRDRSNASESLHAATRGLLSSLVDGYGQIEEGLLARRRTRSVLLTVGQYARERWAEEREAGTLATWNARTTADIGDALTNPAIAGGLRTLSALASQPEALPAASRFLQAILDHESNPRLSRALIAWAVDALQTVPGDASTTALLRALATAAAKNVDDVLRGTGKLETEKGLLFSNLFMVAQTAAADVNDVLGPVLRALTRSAGTPANARGLTPVVALSDAILDINRVDPTVEGPHSAADYKAAFKRIADVMTDENRGFERLYRIVQCATSESGSTRCE